MMREYVQNFRAVLKWLTPIAGVVLFFSAGVQGQKSQELKPTVGTAVKFDISPPLNSIPPKPFIDEQKGEDDRGRPGPVNDTKHDPDPAVQRWFGEGIFSSDSLIPAPVFGFAGMSGTVQPPDTVGDVGPSHYVQMVNSRFQVFNKSTGASVLGPVNINTLWSGFGGSCQNENSGDPVVLHDQLANRWLITQFTSAGPTYFNCVALSTTSNPAGSYYRWAFTTGTSFPDYPKYGVWSDGYYISTREFSAAGPFAGVGAYALNRDQMLLGNAAPQVVSFIIPPGAQAYRVGDGLLPADLDGSTLPPAGSPQFYVGSMDGGAFYGAPADALNLFKFSVNWTTPASSTFVFSNQINTAAFDSIFPCTPSSRTCITQPGTTNKLDILSYRQRPLHRLSYRNFGTHESLVTNQSVEATSGVAGIRWWEIRSPNAGPVIYQEGTYSPDSVHRWMGSIAMDQKGNMVMGYSVSDATVSPGIRYTGRLVTDPLGTMPQGEGVMATGAGALTSGNRWGDYSSINIDPDDDCTFWYTTEYTATTSTTSWVSRISSVILPGCLAPTAANVEIAGKVTTNSGRGLRGVVVKLESTSDGRVRFTRTSSFGFYNLKDITAGETYLVTATSKEHVFPPKVIFVSDSLSAVDFLAETGDDPAKSGRKDEPKR